MQSTYPIIITCDQNKTSMVFLVDNNELFIIMKKKKKENTTKKQFVYLPIFFVRMAYFVNYRIASTSALRVMQSMVIL